jgi:hypothetical protein
MHARPSGRKLEASSILVQVGCVTGKVHRLPSAVAVLPSKIFSKIF